MIVGTAGHVDHGKTSLVQALTGVDADRLKEEKARGISIDIGFAYMPAADGLTIGFVDVPGHERFIRNMLAGATGIDFAVLVVAADDGVMPQTREHVAILDLLGVCEGVVALTKADLVGPDRLTGVRNEISNVLLGTALENSEIIPVSSVTGMGITKLRDHLVAAARARQESGLRDGAFRLAVDRSFSLTGAGTVVTGTVLSGSVAVGDNLIVSPIGLPARVRGIRAQNMKVDRGVAGDRCALNLAGDGVTRDAISRGDMVMDAGIHAPCDRIDARLRVLRSETKPLPQWMPARLHHAALEVGARIVLLGDRPISPGEEGFVQLVLERPVPMTSGDRFVIRDTSGQRTIGGGTLLDLRAPGRKRRTPERMAKLQAYLSDIPEKVLAGLLEAPPHHIDIDGFQRDFSLSPQQIDAIANRLNLKRLRAGGKTLVLAAAAWARFPQAVTDRLKQFHADNPALPGIGVERLRLQIEPRLPAPAFITALRELADSGHVAMDGTWVKSPGHAVQLTPQDAALWEVIEPMLGGAVRFRPPRVRDIAHKEGIRETEVRDLLKRLARMARVDEIDRDHFLLRSTIAEIVGIAHELSETSSDGQFSVAMMRDRLDNGRKMTIHILEFLDRHGVTFRREDLRRINRNRLDFFWSAENCGPSRETRSNWKRCVPGGASGLQIREGL